MSTKQSADSVDVPNVDATSTDAPSTETPKERKTRHRPGHADYAAAVSRDWSDDDGSKYTSDDHLQTLLETRKIYKERLSALNHSLAETNDLLGSINEQVKTILITKD